MVNVNDPNSHPPVRISRAGVIMSAVLTACAASVVPVATFAQASTVPRDASLETLLGAKDWLNGTPSHATLRANIDIR